MSLVKTVATAIGAAALMATAVTATNLRIQTHYAPETVSEPSFPIRWRHHGRLRNTIPAA